MSNFQKRDESKRLPGLLIGVPCGDRVHIETMFSLWSLGRNYAGPQGLQFARNSIVANGRNMLANGVRELGLEWLLMIDSDMAFPQDTAHRLLAHDKDVVACAYRRRGPPFDVQVHRIAESDPEVGLQEVESIATGIMLIRASIFNKMKQPIFRFIPDESIGTHHGEDYSFCKAVREAGGSVYCDWDLSREVRHFFEYGLSLADTEAETNARRVIEEHQSERAL